MATPLKDIFFQPAFVHKLADEVKTRYPAFDPEAFSAQIYTPAWEGQPLKERMHTIAHALRRTLPQSYAEAVEILKMVEQRFDAGFDHLLFADFVELYGVDDYDTSIPALEVFTRSSAESAIRPFILRYPDRTMAQMLAWSTHEAFYVRRLASEGCRPRLPWAIALPAFQHDPSPILPILENLKNDPAETVRRSVANNLNDISKDNPDIVLETAQRWKGTSAQTDKLLKHALRGLLKKGNPDALALFGYTTAAGVAVTDLTIQPQPVAVGGVAEFSFVLEVIQPADLRLEYEIGYMKARGELSPKVFLLSERFYKKGTHTLKRKQSFANMTTRTHHPGRHTLTIRVNGQAVETVAFEVV